MGKAHISENDNIYLPASFLGSCCWSSNQVSNCLAIVTKHSCPTFFVTMTCNTEWPEISSQLLPGQDYTDIPLVVVCVYKWKLALLEHALETMFPNCGNEMYSIQTTKFQQCGQPHTHFLIKYRPQCVSSSDIDSIISAEVPSDPVDAHLVHHFMTHHHQMDDSQPMSKYCQCCSRDGKRYCHFGYP